jgi:hypothetical protein
VTSVTVLQHIPHEEQPQVVRKLRTLLRDGGHALLLENVADDAPHVFSRSVDGWRRLFESSRFSIVAERPYDYSPSLRLLGALTRRLRGARSEAATPETYLVPAADGPPRRRLASAVLRAAQRGAVAVDRVIEPRLVARAAPLPSVHHGYLLRASVSSTASASRGAARGW